jgi:CP family cyanate transporter-like MFS transporter
VALFALMASTYYGINAWLPDSYVERGWSLQAAGSLLAVLNLVAIPASFVVPWLSDRVGTRHGWLIAMATAFVVGMSGVVLVPAAAYAWVVALGIASGGMFALVLTLPLDLEHEPRRVGALVGMMLGLGYTIGAVSPFLLGAMRDLTGSFTASLWLLAGLSGLLLGSVAALPRQSSAGAHP